MLPAVMATAQDAARIAAVLADPARLALLAALLEGEATVTELAARAGLPQPRVSSHLARLRGIGLVTHVAMGRHRAYRVDRARVKPLLAALYATGPAAVLRPSPQAGRERRRDSPLRRARTCYDHLAGVAGVTLLDDMRKRRWMTARTDHGPAFALTPSGTNALAGRGVAIDAARDSARHFAPACLDWTERRPHLGGALGAAVLDALRKRGYVKRRRGQRAVRIVRPLTGWIGR